MNNVDNSYDGSVVYVQETETDRSFIVKKGHGGCRSVENSHVQ